jgi:hypothetical protein
MQKVQNEVLELAGDSSRTESAQRVGKVSLWFEDSLATAALLGLFAACVAVLHLERKEADPAFLPLEEVAYWKRHERNSAECRGQQYIAQCCSDARTDLTCIYADIKGPK